MFDPYCPTCDRRILLGTRRVERIDQTPEGPVAHLRCFCGTAVVWPSVPPFDRPVSNDGEPTTHPIAISA